MFYQAQVEFMIGTQLLNFIYIFIYWEFKKW
jgi:hypothetical protein